MLKIKHGGIHPDDNKDLTANKQIETLPIPAKLIIPVKQHIGAPCSPIVKIGDLVKKGQVLAEDIAKKAPPIHSPSSGKIIDIGNYPHPIFGIAQSIVIETDGIDEWLPGLLTERNIDDLSATQLIELIFQNGIVGLGGAAFPVATKLQPPKDKTIDTIIINGAECEPYLTADYRVMLEYPELLLQGCKIIMKILNVQNCIIGIEDNKPKAIKLLKKLGKPYGIKVITLKTLYPQGGEKMMINVITGKEIPSGKLPMDVGCVVQNVTTCMAIANAVLKNIPLIERIVTVSGKTIVKPKNVLAKIGTSFKDAIDFCGGFSSTPDRILMGGPMMGIAQGTIDTVIVKASSGILALSKKDIDNSVERPCIRCGRCVDACTMRLRPNVLSMLSEKHKHKTALVEYDLLDCVECGCCSFVCPAKRNIVHYIKLSKAKNLNSK
ncbi:MAG: electron transport complex subunit RsxC [Candidatus Riflemargulisbacteria bacterium]